MIKNYLKIAWRNLLKNRQFTFLNLAGLATGLACTILIYLWVNDELHVDKFHKNDRQLFQVMQNLHEDNGILTIEYTPGLLAKAMSEEIPEVQYATSVVPSAWFSNKGILSFKDKHIKSAGQFISKNYFTVFSCRFIRGDKNQVLVNKHNIAISDELAQKLFGGAENAIGKTVQWNHINSGTDFSGLFIVAGIFEKPPSNATARFDLLLNYELFLEKRPSLLSWGNSDPSTFVVLRKGININQFNNKIAGFLKSKYKESQGTLFLQKYSDRYLYGSYENGVQVGGRIEYIRLFSVIAIFILVIACINFMNLSTAKALRRLKEVGIKKAMGVSRKALVFQYLTESTFMTLLSLPFAILLVVFFLPSFNHITGKELTINFDTNIIISVLSITLVTGFISGSYPALYLSGFNAATVLKGKLPVSMSELFVRKGLVVFQFTLSAILIVSVLVIYRQIKYVLSKNLGYNKDNIISFKKEGKLSQSLTAFLSEVKNLPAVVNATSSDHNLIGDHGGTSGIDWEGKDPSESVQFGGLWVDYDFIETLGLEMKEGRSFSRKFGSDTLGIMLNEAAIAAMKFKDPIGKTVDCWGKKPIIGVVKNFHYESLYEKVKPCFLLFASNANNILVKIERGKEKETIGRINQLYQQYNRGIPFEYKFLDENYQALYASEQRVAVLSRYFTVLAILISCLGLFGLAAFTAQKRQKEIGIRKVVGATVTNVVTMLSKGFLKLVLVAILIAFPLSWWAMNQWLQSFAYRINIGAEIFIIAGASIIIITLLTISFQSVKAAIANPVKSLRTE